MRSQTTVLGLDGPAVLGLGDLAVVLADHGLNGNGHAGHKARAAALMAVVGHFRVLVQLTAGAVAHELADDRETGILAVALHGIADVADAVAGHSLLDAFIQSSLGHIQQALCFQIDLAHRIGAGIVAVEAIDLCAGVDADDITGTNDDVMRRDTMDDGIVQADAGRARKAIQTLEIGGAAVLHDEVVDQLIQFPCGHTCFDMLTAVLQGSCAQGICLAHAVQLFRIFDLNHDYASKAFMTSAVVSSMEGQNLISASLPRVR